MEKNKNSVLHIFYRKIRKYQNSLLENENQNLIEFPEKKFHSTPHKNQEIINYKKLHKPVNPYIFKKSTEFEERRKLIKTRILQREEIFENTQINGKKIKFQHNLHVSFELKKSSNLKNPAKTQYNSTLNSQNDSFENEINYAEIPKQNIINIDIKPHDNFRGCGIIGIPKINIRKISKRYENIVKKLEINFTNFDELNIENNHKKDNADFEKRKIKIFTNVSAQTTGRKKEKSEFEQKMFELFCVNGKEFKRNINKTSRKIKLEPIMKNSIKNNIKDENKLCRILKSHRYSINM